MLVLFSLVCFLLVIACSWFLVMVVSSNNAFLLEGSPESDFTY